MNQVEFQQFMQLQSLVYACRLESAHSILCAIDNRGFVVKVFDVLEDAKVEVKLDVDVCLDSSEEAIQAINDTIEAIKGLFFPEQEQADD